MMRLADMPIHHRFIHDLILNTNVTDSRALHDVPAVHFQTAPGFSPTIFPSASKKISFTLTLLRWSTPPLNSQS